MFIQVDSVVRDSPDIPYSIRVTHLQTDWIKDFRVWHRGKGNEYEGVKGDFTKVLMERTIDINFQPQKWFVIINEKESDFRNRLNMLNSGIPCPTVKTISNP